MVFGEASPDCPLPHPLLVNCNCVVERTLPSLLLVLLQRRRCPRPRAKSRLGRVEAHSGSANRGASHRALCWRQRRHPFKRQLSRTDFHNVTAAPPVSGERRRQSSTAKGCPGNVQICSGIILRHSD